MKLRNLALLLLPVIVFLSCDSRPGANDTWHAWNVDSELSADPIVTDLPLLNNGGSAMSFLDSLALTKVYGRVFAPSAYGYKRCEHSKPADQKACDNIFSPDEVGTLGTFSLYNPSLDRGVQNVNLVTSLSLNYVRSLRSGLSRECKALVKRELEALANGLAAKNFLVKSENPSAADIDAFLVKILGLEKAGAIDLDFDAKGYADDFPKAVAMMPDQAKARQNAYLNLCIAVAMDPQVFLY